MLFYWGLWLFVCLFGVIGLNRANYSKKGDAIFLIFLVILAALVGGREYVGSDWESYWQYYKYGYDIELRDQMEYLFQFIRTICFKLGLSFGFFSFLISLISLLAIRKALQLAHVENCWLAFLVYLSMMFCHYQLNVIRHGAMASLVLLAFVYKAKGNNIKGLLCLIAGIGFHKTGVLFFLMYPFMDKALNKKVIFAASSIAVVLFILGLSRFFTSIIPALSLYLGYDSYLDVEHWGRVGLSVGLVGKILFFVYSYFFQRELYASNIFFRMSVNLLFASIILNLAAADFAVFMERVVNAMSMSLMIIIPLLLDNLKADKKKLLAALFILYLGLYYPLIWNRDEAQMLPFKTDITNLFN